MSTVFLVPTVLSKTLYEMQMRTGIARVVTHGEKAAAYMADGYVRASGPSWHLFVSATGER